MHGREEKFYARGEPRSQTNRPMKIKNDIMRYCFTHDEAAALSQAPT